MSENKKLVPKRRFKEFQNTDAWEQLEFSELLDEEDGIRRGPFGSALKKEFFVTSSDYVVYEQQNAIYDRYNTRYNISKEKFEELHRFTLQPNDFILSGAGTIGRISKVPEGIRQGVFNQALIRIKINDEVTDSNFFLQWMRSDDMQKKLTYANPASAMVNLVPMQEVKKWSVIVPDKDEQSKLGDFFNRIDQTIAFQQQKLEKMKSMKSAYLSEMFPAEGERKPKRRFPGFTDDWKQRELGKVLGNLTDGDWIEKEHISDKGKYRIIQTGNIGIGEYYNKGKDAKFLNQSSFDVLNGNEIFPGDILISRLAEPAGRTIILPNTGSRMVTAVDVAIVRPNSNFSSYFIQTMMNTNETLKKINEEASGSTRKRISRKNLELIDLIIPEIQEQEKIGNFFKNLDQTIAFQQQKLEKLQNIKKAYLNEMFI